MKYAGVTLPTHDDYTPWHAAFGECYPDIMVGDLAGAEAIYDAGKLPVIHPMFKWPEVDATIQNIAVGRYKTQIDAWLETLKAYCDTGRKAIIAWLPEFNGNWCVYATDDASPQAFKASWNYVVGKAEMIGLDETMVKWCWAPNNFGIGDLADWWPGNADLIGGSAYNMGGLYPDVPWETFTYLADKYVREIRGFTDLPILITQTGTPLGDSRSPGWLDNAVSYTLNWDNIIGFIYYNENEFAWGPGRDDFNDRMQPLSAERPDHWFQEDTMPESPTRFPGATWVGSKMPGKRWAGTTNPIVVIHTLEFNAWPDPDRWDAPAHIVCNPNTGEIRQYLSMDKAAYSVRDNALEDDYPTYQVELWGKAANVPGYSDVWYRGVAELVKLFRDYYGIPVIFEDFTNVQYGAYAPQRRDDDEIRAFTGFVGHCHMGRGVDTHWDPGKLDVTKVLQFAGGVHVPPPPIEKEEHQMKTIKRGDGYVSKGTADKKPTVGAWQAILAGHGFADQNTSDGSGCAIDRVFGPGTEESTIQFQRSRGIPDDGVVGDITWAEGEKVTT